MQRDRLLLAEMIEAVDRIVQIVADGEVDAIASDPNRRDALLWNFTVLGEAASQVSAATRESHADVPWRQPVGLRNRIVHGYWEADLDVLVRTAREDLPPFRAALHVVVAALPEDVPT